MCEAIVSAFVVVVVLACVLSGFWLVIRHSYRVEGKEADVECRLLVLEQALIDKLAKNKNIDIEREVIKQEMTLRGKLRGKIYKEIIADNFKGIEKQQKKG